MKTRYLTALPHRGGRHVRPLRLRRRLRDARSERRGAPAQRPPRRLHRRADQGMPGGGGDPVPRWPGAGDRLFVRLLRALHLPAPLLVAQSAHLSDDAGAVLSGAHQALDWHRDRGLLSRLSLRAGRHDLRSRGTHHVACTLALPYCGPNIASDRRRAERRLLPDLPVPVPDGDDGPAGRRHAAADGPGHVRLHVPELPGGRRDWRARARTPAAAPATASPRAASARMTRAAAPTRSATCRRAGCRR